MNMEEYDLIPIEIPREDAIQIIMSYMIMAGLLGNHVDYLRQLLRCTNTMLAYEMLNAKDKLKHYLKADAMKRRS